MIRYLATLAAAMSLLLAGCATTIRSDVTAFHQWPAELRDKSYAFQAPAQVEDTLEYRSYLDLVRAELGKLGFNEAAGPEAARLKVAVRFATIDRPVRVMEMTDPFWSGPGYWPGRYGYRYPWGYPRWHGFRPYYDPFMFGPLDMRESIRHNYERQLRVTIDGADGKKLFDVTAQNTSRVAATPVVMPALVASAFAGFPGQSGVPRRVDLKVE
ncbi:MULTISPECIES: DUF4136 domain-containing protein [unclassified Janthinobacterium]|uniref:DUF4136 domain-containing protein n=1 Tax=unclassified Janthinobacterium TaxID=2610881 RepID=UPI00034C871A|nr:MULTISPECIES: DUF4136 domain-containing protein [unclassified Janthinobacterium]MEC5159830.1 hypothetical protein [Janthinobacterium sp. CG_S6]